MMEIIEAVNRLDEQQKGEFLARLEDVDFDDPWDRQIAADAEAGTWKSALTIAEAYIVGGSSR